ncbi:hypothetical protein Tco_1010373 [Tanacetum coccineum]
MGKTMAEIVGPVADTFLNHSPEVVLDTSTQEWGTNPLLSFAFESEFNNSIFLPVFSSHSESTCLGVVECSIKYVDNQGCIKDIDNSPGNGNGNALSEPPRSLKRKFEDIPKSLDDDVVIMAHNISKDFHLDSLHFTLEDECEDGTCFRIDDNESLESCIAWGRTNRSHIKLRVHPRH